MNLEKTVFSTNLDFNIDDKRTSHNSYESYRLETVKIPTNLDQNLNYDNTYDSEQTSHNSYQSSHQEFNNNYDDDKLIYRNNEDLGISKVGDPYKRMEISETLARIHDEIRDMNDSLPFVTSQLQEIKELEQIFCEADPEKKYGSGWEEQSLQELKDRIIKDIKAYREDLEDYYQNQNEDDLPRFKNILEYMNAFKKAYNSSEQ
jgi:hypothetical protein